MCSVSVYPGVEQRSSVDLDVLAISPQMSRAWI